MSIFIVDLKEAIGKGMTIQPIANMVNHETNEVFFDNLEIVFKAFTFFSD